MHLGEISFCDKIGFNIKSDEFKKKILTDLESKYNFKIIQKHYERFGENSPTILQNNPHLVSLRSNGNPYLLYLTRMNEVNQCVFIDKKIQHGYFYPRMIISRFWFHDSLFQNTLFDGEMVKDKDGKWVFLMNDMLADCGVTMEAHNLVKRLNRMYEVLGTGFTADELDICNFQVKKYFHYHEYEHMMGPFMKDLPYTCRGLYFKPLFIKFRDILFNFDDTLIKKVVRTKYKSVSTFLLTDDLIKTSPDTSEMQQTAPEENKKGSEVTRQDTAERRVLFVTKTSQSDIYDVIEPCTNQPLGVACVNNLKTSKMMRAVFADATPTEKKKMECVYVAKFAKWEPLHESK